MKKIITVTGMLLLLASFGGVAVAGERCKDPTLIVRVWDLGKIEAVEPRLSAEIQEHLADYPEVGFKSNSFSRRFGGFLRTNPRAEAMYHTEAIRFRVEVAKEILGGRTTETVRAFEVAVLGHEEIVFKDEDNIFASGTVLVVTALDRVEVPGIARASGEHEYRIYPGEEWDFGDCRLSTHVLVVSGFLAGKETERARTRAPLHLFKL